MNPRITKKEQGLLKGAIRRVFSRSELRKFAILTSIIEYIDPKRPRVKKWSMCTECKQPTPTYLMQVDHIDPIIPISKSLDTMSWDDVIDRTWCEQKGLNPLCKPCHSKKTKEENKLRRRMKNERKTD